MAKKLVAVTEIRHDDQVIAPGETLDASKFDKKQLESLYDAGAVRVDDGSTDAEAAQADTEKTDEENPQSVVSANQSAAASSPVNAAVPPTGAKAAGTKETANGKSGAK